MRGLWLLIAVLLSAGCASAPKPGVTKSVSLTIEVRHKDGRLQWRTAQTLEAGTDDPPGMNERIGK
jgi:hypothetical protein